VSGITQFWRRCGIFLLFILYYFVLWQSKYSQKNPLSRYLLPFYDVFRLSMLSLWITLNCFSRDVKQPTISFLRLPETICFERTEAETLYSLDIYSAIKRKQKTKNKKQTNKQTNKQKQINVKILPEDQKAHRPLIHKPKLIYIYIFIDINYTFMCFILEQTLS
jgi:hypothetical protein